MIPLAEQEREEPMEPEMIPHVLATVTKGRDVWDLTIRCPYCGQKHYHGRGPITGEPSGGHRVAHCVDKRPGNHGYYIDLPMPAQ
jgi:hypothetical protein